MSNKRVKLIRVDLERRGAGLTAATSPNLPEFFLVTKHDRLDEDIPAALKKFYRMKHGEEAEIVPIEDDDEMAPAQWAAILASGRDSALA